MKNVGITPNGIDLNKGLLGAFGKAEMETAAKKIITLCQQAGEWIKITIKQLAEGASRFLIPGLYLLAEESWIKMDEEGNCEVTPNFVQCCYEKYPVAV